MSQQIDKKKTAFAGLHDLAFYANHRRRTQSRPWKNVASQRSALIKCNTCGTEKTVKVGANWNPESSGGMLSSCKGTCNTGTSGTFHSFVKFEKAIPSQETPKQ